MYEHGMIAPIVALVAWSLLMLIWLYITRFMGMARFKLRPGKVTKEQIEALPGWVKNPAANYTHLMETPTIFYAIAFSLQLLDQAHPINIGLAWLYVTIRIVHSLVQATFNFIPLRFLLFVASAVVLVMLTVHAAIGVGMIQWDFHH